MTIPAHIAQTLVELRQRRDMLNDAIHVLSIIWERPDAPTPAAEPQRPTPRIAAAKPTLERRRKVRSGSDDETYSTILSALRKAARPMSVLELERETKLSRYLLKSRLKAMSGKRLVVMTGKTAGRRVALPGTTPAKEEP